MVLRYLGIHTDATVGDALTAIRSAPDEVERTAYVYVLDDEDWPVGVLSVRDLLSAPREEPVQRITGPDVVAVEADDEAVKAAQLLRNRGLKLLPVAIRSIALGEVRIRDFWQAVRKEVAVGLVNGAFLGLLFAGVATLLEGNPWLGLVAGVALGMNVLVAGVVGGGLPSIIKRLGKDPAMMTGPFLTTVTDITGVSIYLGLSTVFLTQIMG